VGKRQSNVPVFLIYAGVIHAIGLALLLPMLITLPGPGSEIDTAAPEPATIDVEIIPAHPLGAKTEPDSEQTSALPPPPQGDDARAAAEPSAGGEAVATVTPEAEPKAEETSGALPQETPDEAASPAQEETKPEAAKPAEASQGKAVKKPVAARSRAAKSMARRSDKTKIAPFNGALTGLFSPGAPVKRR
jgi:type IV secretory pathway VirB10-like protein